MTPPPLLTVSGLTCEREGRVLFADLSFSVGAGEYLELTGPNGSGKSTLLRCITGLFQDYEGELEAAPFLYLGHKPGISPLLTPLDNLRWLESVTETRGDPAAALARVGMAGYQHIHCRQLSAGQQRRVALARLLLAVRPLWLLDEPLTALDQAGQSLVRTLISEHVAGGGAVLCATHQTLAMDAARGLELGASGVTA